MGLSKRRLRQVREVVEIEIASHAARGPYGAGLAAEGYAGGYRDALDDILSVMHGVEPQRAYWTTPTPGGGDAEK